MQVDFSPLHDILIHHKDGSYTPMDEPYYEVSMVNEDTWQIMSSGDYHYLMTGADEGIAIDTGYGAGNLREFLEGLCGMPVPSVINTHSHFDHSANNCYFEKAYMGKDAVDLVSVPYPSFGEIDFHKDSYEKVVVGDMDLIPLKKRILEIFEIGDHTEDGIAILDRKGRILFTGDEITTGPKRLNGSVLAWKNKLDKIMAHRSEFDILCGGPDILPATELDIIYEACEKILAGEPSEEKPKEHKHPHFGEQSLHDGHRVYDCQLPHMEDMPKDGLGQEARKNFIYQGHVIQYLT